MPELPEVEVLVRHLAPQLQGRRITDVEVRRPRVVRPESAVSLRRALVGARFGAVIRRAKYLVFELRGGPAKAGTRLIGHLGMTGRMYLQPAGVSLPRHAAVVIRLGREVLVFEDTRYFGRLHLDAAGLDELGPEPLADDFTPAVLAAGLGKSAQAVKVRLLDQRVVAGVGNIYASEALFRAGISPRTPSRRIPAPAMVRLHAAVRAVLTEAIAAGSTMPLDFSGGRDGLFYYGSAADAASGYEERLQVYDRAGQPCLRCGTPIRRIVQAARSTFWCPACQPARPR